MVENVQLGAFSMSLNVADLEASAAFYEKLGFSSLGGDSSGGYLMMKSGDTVIGLFQGHIPANTLTFNPGWTPSATEIEGEWDDIRSIQSTLDDAGIELVERCEADGEGPAHIVLLDPDRNAILIDQHR